MTYFSDAAPVRATPASREYTAGPPDQPLGTDPSPGSSNDALPARLPPAWQRPTWNAAIAIETTAARVRRRNVPMATM